MTREELNAWVLLAATLTRLGIDAVAAIKSIFADQGKTDEELNEVLVALQDSILQHRAISAAIAFGA